jgi:Na+/melibiose symporter-like transporter
VALAGFLFLNTLYLQDMRGFSAMKAGLMTLPMAAVTAIVSPFSGRLVAERGSRLPLTASGIVIGVTGLLLLWMSNSTSLVFLGAVYALFGFGFGVVNAPITNTAVSGMPRAQSGVAAAVASTSRQVGQSLGVALIGTVTVAQVHGSMRQGFATASHAGWLIVAGCGLIVLILGVLTTTRRARASAERAAALFPEGSDHSAAIAPRANSGTSGTDVDDAAPADVSPDGMTSRVGADGSPETMTR